MQPSQLLDPFRRGDRVGEWEIVRRIGHGGMAVVYEAVHHLIGTRVALKVIRPDLAEREDLVARFVQEAKIVDLIAHADIVDILQIGWHREARVYLVLELLDGRTLAARCEEGSIPTSEAIAIVRAICRPLAWAHAHGVVHRDLKPDNVFLVDEARGPRVKLLDWGLAAEMSDGDRFVEAEWALVGTPRYVAPEQACGFRIDERADIYALGALAYELLLGRTPFESDDMNELVRLHMTEDPPPPHTIWPAIPTELEALLTAMLSKSAADRPSLLSVDAALARLATPTTGATRSRAGRAARAASRPAPRRW